MTRQSRPSYALWVCAADHEVAIMIGAEIGNRTAAVVPPVPIRPPDHRVEPEAARRAVLVRPFVNGGPTTIEVTYPPPPASFRCSGRSIGLGWRVGSKRRRERVKRLTRAPTATIPAIVRPNIHRIV
jgi:hypothetical protein